jgi:hypothetical protein
MTGNVGPVVVPRFGAGVCQDSGLSCSDDGVCGASRCVQYRLAAKDPVPLEGLNQTQQLSAFVVAEAIEGKDLNGDGDTTDDVVLLSNRQTGVASPSGSTPVVAARWCG